jgi:transcriptional regulator with XRE-family HTH domain
MEGHTSQVQLSERLGVTPGRVSQVLNNPGNLRLDTIIQYARALGKKVAIVAYDDGDAPNMNGPINSQVFERCWKDAGCPADFMAFEEATTCQVYPIDATFQMSFSPTLFSGNTSNRSFKDDQSDGTYANKRMPHTGGVFGANNG